jgi:hypothetical protein
MSDTLPYPGMSDAFVAHFGQLWTDPDWRKEASTWAAAWKASHRAAPGDRSIVATYDKLHKDKLGAHWLWCAIEQIAAGVPEDEAMRSFGYYEAGPSRARFDAARLAGPVEQGEQT